MEKRAILAVLLASTLIVAASFLFPGGTGEQGNAEFLPWQITSTADGGSRIFGLTLDQSSLDDAQRRFQAEAEVSLFAAANAKYRLEAYFDRLVLGGFAARMVLALDLPESDLAAMYERGARISSLGQGRQRVTLAAADLRGVQSARIHSIVYLTRAQLDAGLLENRFGVPERRITEQESGIIHWVYPQKGLDIALDGQGNTVLQYISPLHFNELLTPLTRNPSAEKP